VHHDQAIGDSAISELVEDAMCPTVLAGDADTAIALFVPRAVVDEAFAVSYQASVDPL
jgi:hypothetical protein